jgi:integrase
VINRVLAIPTKRYDRAVVSFLTRQEIQALLSSPDQSTWIGRRDHALLLLALQTGLRVSELTRLRRQDVRLDTGAHIRTIGKSRKQRITPLTAQTRTVLRAWLREHPGRPTDPVFRSRRGGALNSDAIAHLVAKHTTTAQRHCPSLVGKKISPHVLRHTAAMQLLQAGVDITVIALWLVAFSGVVAVRYGL